MTLPASDPSVRVTLRVTPPATDPPGRAAVCRAVRTRALVGDDGSAQDLVDVAPSPGLAGFVTADDLVSGATVVPLGGATRGGVAAADIAAAQAQPQVDRHRSLPDAVGALPGGRRRECHGPPAQVGTPRGLR